MLRALLSQIFTRSKPSAQPRGGAGDAPLERIRALVEARSFQAAAQAVAELRAADPERADAAVLEADILRKQGRIAEAIEAYRGALLLDPHCADAWLDLGVCHYLEGDYFWARVYYRFAKTLVPESADILNEFGVAEIALGNFDAAEQSLESAVNLNPQHPEAWNNLGLVIARRRDLPNARRHFLRATFLKPNFYMAHCNLGLVCRELEALEEAEHALRRALEIDPGGKVALLNLGAVLQDQERLDEALKVLGQALAAAPEAVDVLAALSALYLRRGDADNAAAFAREALARDPQDGDARLALAHVQLARGDFAHGWVNYEGRRASESNPVRALPFPTWNGEPLEGKTVLAFGEQGLGDEIMFASCLPDLTATGARCLVDCDPKLRALFRRSFPGVEVVESAAALEATVRAGERRVDFCVPLGSLPLHFRASAERFPAPRAYLAAEPRRVAEWAERLAALGAGLKVGIAWRGGLLKTGREMRSLPLARLVPLLRTHGVRWVSLQPRADPLELEAVRSTHGIAIAAWDETLADQDETAALMSALDLVVTVCSSVVHLGGALGRPVWVLTPVAPAWRYLLEGPRMPWYPSVRLFRQHSRGSWDEPLAAVAGELSARTGGAA
jgi:tetratricopeptide (TPR) repeat protein